MKGSRGNIVIWVTLLVLILIVAFFWWSNSSRSETQETKKQNNQEVMSQSLGTMESEEVLELESDLTSYKSENGFVFDYPQDWLIQSTGTGSEEIVQLFSKQSTRSNIYACVDIRSSSSSSFGDNSQGELVSETPKGLQIFSRTRLAGDEMINLANSGHNTLDLQDGTSFEVTGSFNCIQGDFEVIENDNTFNFTGRPEYSEMIEIFNSFELNT